MAVPKILCVAVSIAFLSSMLGSYLAVYDGSAKLDVKQFGLLFGWSGKVGATGQPMGRLPPSQAAARGPLGGACLGCLRGCPTSGLCGCLLGLASPAGGMLD